MDVQDSLVMTRIVAESEATARFPRVGEVYVNTEERLVSVDLLSAAAGFANIVNWENILIEIDGSSHYFYEWQEEIAAGTYRLAEHQFLTPAQLPEIIPGTLYIGPAPYSGDGGPYGTAEWRVFMIESTSNNGSPNVIVQGYEWRSRPWPNKSGIRRVIRQLSPQGFAEWRDDYLIEMRPIPKPTIRALS